MSRTTGADADESRPRASGRRSRSDRRYDQVLACVEKNTAGLDATRLRPGVPRDTVYLHLAVHGRYEHTGVKESVEEALENDDLVAWVDDEGVGRLTRADAAGLLALLEAHYERGILDDETATRVARLHNEVGDDGE